jgi:LPXTG-site transpeptidase (sortase) family protein
LAVTTQLTDTQIAGAEATTETTATKPEPAGIAPSAVLQLQVPAIKVDARVLPVDSKPTGKKNAWGGDIYSTIDFPVDEDVRQWVRRGDPNTLSAAESEGNVKAFDRVLLYGHASDIGHHLVFQDLAALKAGDSVIATTALGRFTYHVTQVYTRTKTNLSSLAALYDYPTGGAKDLALIACLPDTTSNVVVFATLATAQAL